MPNKIPVFPLSNFIIFPETSVPLNIFEPRYIEMINDSMKNSRMIGLIQPKEKNNKPNPTLYNVGCLVKITSFNETEDGRYLIIINGVNRFNILNEINNNKLYRECEITFNNYKNDLSFDNENMKFSDIEIILRNLKDLFKKRGYNINWQEFKKQNLSQTINTLAMASPFSLEEKQALLETKSLTLRKNKLEEILNTYLVDNFSNTTVQ